MNSRFEIVVSDAAQRTQVFVGEGICPADLAGLPQASTVLPLVDAGVPSAHAVRTAALLSALGQRVLPPLALPLGEAAKSLDGFAALAEAALNSGIDRDTRVVVVGGGATLDCGQFLAAVLLRGLDCCVVPTTLLAQVDAGVGGKCGLDAGPRKNQIGVIRQPIALLLDTGFLSTLPLGEVLSGLAEMAKVALLAGGALHEAMHAHARSGAALPSNALLATCVEYKVRVVERDPLERGERILLNAGHTVGHALEAASLEAGVVLPHGLCVALGLRAEARHFAEHGAAAVEALLDALGLPRRVPQGLDLERAVSFIVADKKRRGAQMRVPVIDAPGQVRVMECAVNDCVNALRTLAAD